jgi:hypothetical protein
MPVLGSLSIRNKLTLMVISVSTLALLVSGIVFISYDNRDSRQSKIQDVTTLADIIGSNSTGALTYQDANSAREVLAALSSKREISEACIYDKRRPDICHLCARGFLGRFECVHAPSRAGKFRSLRIRAFGFVSEHYSSGRKDRHRLPPVRFG